jgi:hypothetical protein
MNKILLSFILSFSLFSIGCASFSHNSHPTVTFLEADTSGKVVRNLRVQLTDSPADTCISGDWKKVKVISDSSSSTRVPAYTWHDDKLEVLLVNMVCDGYDSYIGTVADGIFQGEHVTYGLGFNKTLGTVSGTYSEP